MFTLIMTNSIPRYSMKKYDFPAFFSESRKSGETELPAFGREKKQMTEKQTQIEKKTVKPAMNAKIPI